MKIVNIFYYQKDKKVVVLSSKIVLVIDINIWTKEEVIAIKKYIDYDIENTYESLISNSSEELVKRLLKQGLIKSVYAVRTVQSGKILEVEIYPEFTRYQSIKRKEVKRKSRRSIKNLNDKNARKKLTRLINCNFDDGDIWMTLTYDNKHLPSSYDESMRNFRNYIRKLNYRRKKRNIHEARYIVVTEFGKNTKRIHHHVIIDNLQSMDELESLWKYGRRNNTRKIISDEEGLTGLANYLAKDPKGKKRWSCSKNLKKPKVRKHHQISMKKIREMIEDENNLRLYCEKNYPGKCYLEDRRLYNEVNGKTYMYMRMSIP